MDHDDYGSRSRRGTEVASTFYSLLETAKLRGVDPARYLREAALADARARRGYPTDFGKLAIALAPCTKLGSCDGSKPSTRKRIDAS